MLAAVRAIAPVAGMPPNNADAIFPAPCATNSISERCFPLIMPSATTQESRDSIAASTAMVNAFGTAAFTVSKVTDGRWKDGSALLMVYRFPMVDTFNGRNCTINIPAMTAIRDPGIFLKTIGDTIRIARLTAPTSTAAQLMVPTFSANAANFSIVSMGRTPSG